MGTLRDDILKCRACRLYEFYLRPVPYEGNPEAKVMFVGRDPGDVEVQMLRPFVGDSGIVLRQDILGSLGFDPAEFYIANIACCRPYRNIAPNQTEAAFCADMHLARAIVEVEPKVIVTLGKEAANWVTGKLHNTIGRIRGKESQYCYCHDIKVIPTYHPSYIVRLRKMDPPLAEVRLDEMKSDILSAIALANE